MKNILFYFVYLCKFSNRLQPGTLVQSAFSPIDIASRKHKFRWSYEKWPTESRTNYWVVKKKYRVIWTPRVFYRFKWTSQSIPILTIFQMLIEIICFCLVSFSGLFCYNLLETSSNRYLTNDNYFIKGSVRETWKGV